MFNKHLTISLTIFLILMIITSSIKNKTRNLEKRINILNANITFLKREFKDAKTDFIYLSSPAQLQKYITVLNINDYLSYDNSRIFQSTNEFLTHNQKQTKLLKRK